jgi:cell division protein FtsB
MDNFNDTTKNTGRSSNSPKRPKSDNRWTLLFIGNRGRTITLKRFKGMVLLTLTVLCVSIAISVGLVFLTLNIRQQKAQLEARVNELKDQIKALRYEKDVLMTRLVLAEARPDEDPAKIAKEKTEADPAPKAVADSAKPGGTAETPVSRVAAPAPEKSQPDTAEDQSHAELSVALEDFQILSQPARNLLRFQFKIKNTSADSRRVAGHTMVVLKSDQISPARWLAIPPMPLVDGKPTGRHKGHSFGINHFKTMRFSANYPKLPHLYQTATVYIFSNQGELLLEADFPIALPASGREAPAASSSSDETSPAGSPPASTAASAATDKSPDTRQAPAAE